MRVRVRSVQVRSATTALADTGGRWTGLAVAARSLVLGAGRVPTVAEQAAALVLLVPRRARVVVEGVQADGSLEFDRAVQERGGRSGQSDGHLGERETVAVLRLAVLGTPGPVEAEAEAVGVRDVVGEERVGQEDDRGGTAVGRRLQGDPDVLPLCETADHEQSEAVGVGEFELRCLGEPQVGVEQRLGGHAQTPVVDLQGEAVGDALPQDLDGGVRRGEHRGVLQEFGHQVGQVGDGGADDGDPRQSADLDALVVLDLGDGRAHDVHELDGFAPLPGGRGTGEDHQALGVPAHAGGEVVEAEEVGEFLGVVGPALHGVQEGELFVQQDLAATGEVDEDLRDPGAQFGLFDGRLHGGALQGVEGLADLADLVPVVLQARDLGLDVHLFARREAAHHAGQSHTGRLVGLQAQPAQVADEAAAHAYGQEERDEQGEQAEESGDDGLGDDAHGDGPDPVLVAVVGLVVEGAEFLEHMAGRGVPALRGDPAGRSGAGGEGRLLGDPQRRGRRVLPEALVAVPFRGGQLRQSDVVQQRALGHEVGDVPGLGAGEPTDDEGGAEQGVLTGEEFTGTGEADEGAVLLVQPDVVDHVQTGQQGVARVGQPVVEVEGLGAVDGAVLDTAAQGIEAVEGVQYRAQRFGVLAHRVAHIGVRRALPDIADGPVGGGTAAAEGGEPVGGARVREVDQSLAALLLEDADGFLDGVTDLFHHRRHVEEMACLTARQQGGEGPDRRQGHQRHEKQCHDLPADGLPAKAHGLPQLGPREGRGHTCASTNGASLLPSRGQLEELSGIRTSALTARHGELSWHWGRLTPGSRRRPAERAGAPMSRIWPIPFLTRESL
ncbi:hypothetical protein A4U61_17815 [Streptomyces sp. H-KF8]|nr:hypothetical protein A4U61_17815 [Streptomyces sp. H-KF8]